MNAPVAAVFERRKKYDVPVRMSRHPGLNEYIHQVRCGFYGPQHSRPTACTLAAAAQVLVQCKPWLERVRDARPAQRPPPRLIVARTLQGVVEKIVLVVFNSQGAVMERFVFQVSMAGHYTFLSAVSHVPWLIATDCAGWRIDWCRRRCSIR